MACFCKLLIEKRLSLVAARKSVVVGFAPSILSHAPVAQLDRVPGYEPGGREFESLRARQFSLTATTSCRGSLLPLVAVTRWLRGTCGTRHRRPFPPQL